MGMMEQEIKKVQEIGERFWNTPSPEGIRKYYKGLGYKRSSMFNDELDALEDIYADGLEQLELEFECMLPGFVENMEAFVTQHKTMVALKKKLLNMEYKRGVMDDTNTTNTNNI